MRIRSATPDDDRFIGELAGEVFALYGSYAPLLPAWRGMEGVFTFVGETDRERIGCVMLAFFREPSGLVGDVLAIGVVPVHQRRGLGRTLLAHAIDVCERLAERAAVRAVRLSVAETNEPARRLFESCGFRAVPGDWGTYEGGQRVLHLERPVGGAGAPHDAEGA